MLVSIIHLNSMRDFYITFTWAYLREIDATKKTILTSFLYTEQACCLNNRRRYSRSYYVESSL
uniref:Uncharacterized protein n=1 Tax=Glossina brevipalpis TaxID=37001 RepID=A0A1A9WFQ5_9MUSC